MTQQCKLLALNRSSVYCRPVDVCHEDLRLMKAIDEIHLEQSFRGSRRIRDELLDRKVVAYINRKKVQRLIPIGHKCGRWAWSRSIRKRKPACLATAIKSILIC
ncbi:IS3 family transposase [Methylobacter luteus]|uniref:IS3 family transposase n=1 Tax=Methylobacter luteus TaxID=415 RepID=UPI0012DE033F|nr:IS3 family transposase [Methylobacter luteus]